ncbi:MAG: response regulator [Cyanobacteria bacterium P01_G01_bin.39]
MFYFSQQQKLATAVNNLSFFQNTEDLPLSLDSRINKVLIADEEPEIRDALSVAVRRWAQEEQRNVEIIFVKNGQQAIDYVKNISQENPVFLAIIDLRMPQMNGLETAQNINDLYPKMPIIITASPNEVDDKLIQEADDFANQNSHMGFMIRTKSSHLFKVALEFEISKLEVPQGEQKPADRNLIGHLREKLNAMLN